MKIKDVAVKYSYLFRTLLTVLIALCIPFTMMGLGMIQRGYDQLRQSNNASYLDSVKNFAAYFDEQTDQMTTSALKIGLERNLLRSTIEAHPWNVVEAIQLMSSYQSGLNFVQAIGLYYRDSDYILTSHYRVGLSDFAAHYTNGNAVHTQKIVDFIKGDHHNKGDYFSLYPNTSEPNAAIFFAVPIFMNSNIYRDSVMVYVLTPESFKSFNYGAYATGRHAQMIFDGTQNLIYTSKNTNAFLNNEDFQAFLHSEAVNLFEYAADVHYNVYKYQDAKSRQTYVSIVRREIVEENLLTFYRQLRAILVLSVFCLLVLLTVSVYFNYKPVSRILRKILPAEGEEPVFTDEFTRIANTLERANTAREQIHAQATEQKLILIDYIVNNLLQGAEVSTQEIFLWEPDVREKCFFTATAIGLRLDNQTRQTVIDRVSKNSGVRLYIADMPHENHTVFVFAINKEKMADGTQTALRAAVCPPCESQTLRAGHIVDVPEKIHESYIRSLGTEDYEPVSSFFAQNDEQSALYSVKQAEALLAFLRYIRSGETQRALACLHDLFAYFNQSKLPAAVERFICYDILNQYLHVAKRLDMSPDFEQIAQLVSFTSPKDLHMRLEDIVRKLCEAIHRKRQYMKDNFSRSIVVYVDENFASEETTLMNVGDHFNLSIYALSRLFKEATGQGFKEYVTKKRLDKGLGLLTGTEMNLKDIAVSTGFSNADYFAKIFKSHFGISPSNLRSGARLPAVMNAAKKNKL